MRRLILWTIFVLLIVMMGSLWVTAQTGVDPSQALIASGINERSRIAFVSNRSGNEDIFIMNLDGSGQIPLTDSLARDWHPSWTPDGETIAFASNRDGISQIYTITYVGQRERRLMPTSTFNDFDPAWSQRVDVPVRIAFVSDRSENGFDIFIADRNGNNVEQITSDGQIKGHPSWSPDGQYLVYWVRRGDGTLQIMRSDVATKQIQLLTNAGRFNGWPRWSPDGSQILYDTDRDSTWHVYSMQTNGNSPRILSRAGFNSGRVDWSPNGGEWLLFTTDRDESDEIYVMRADGTGERRLTNNSVSDHSATWQPVVPVEDFIEDESLVSEEEAEEPDFINQGFGQTINRASAPVSKPDLLFNTGIQAWHVAGWRGEDIAVGVIDLDFGRLIDFQNDFGTAITVPTELGETEDQVIRAMSSNRNPHGTQVLEIIHTVAPEADLYACQYEVYDGFRDCIEWMISQNVRIINHSAGLPALPLDGTNEWAQMASRAVQRNIFWVNSAGNFAGGFLRDSYTDSQGNNVHEFRGTTSLNNEIIRFDDVSVNNPYSGNIILSWNDVRHERLTNDLGTPLPPVDPLFEIELVDLATNTVITNYNRFAESQRLANRIDRINLPQMTSPFGLRIVNRRAGFEGAATMVLFMEFVDLENGSLRGSVIAPGDSSEVYTVGAVEINNEIAPYSSRGLLDSNRSKPDLTAPGAINLQIGGTFVGTSAAAPVVAGVAALIWQENPALTSSTLRRELDQFAIPRQQEATTYGSGILRMNAPDSSRQSASEQTLLAEVPPKIIFPAPPEPTPTPVPQCPGAMPKRLLDGEDGYVLDRSGVFVRSLPNTQGRRITTLYLGDRFTVIEEAGCSASFRWYFVELDGGGRGYIAEGSGYYLTTPIQLNLAEYPKDTAEVCPLAPDSQLNVGTTAVVGNAPRGGLTLWDKRDFTSVVAGFSNGTEVYVLGGPVCAGDSNAITRWYVRVLSGNLTGAEGWMSEAMPGTRWLTPQEN